jgi:RimJ/RimL family protein N-acetyltransferase
MDSSATPAVSATPTASAIPAVSATPTASATPAVSAPYASSSVEVSTTEPTHQNLNPFYSERLTFRPLQESDFPAYHAILKQEQTMVDAGLGPMYDEKRARDWFNTTQESFTRVGIFLKNSDNTEGELIGDGGFIDLLTNGLKYFTC